ncbi:MAG: class I adenylate-forming enzyme family protein [Dehalococcoidales bacterium]|nr:class I adenylate-forming enzyme family protein [Dehalococcoidales bacterium]
MTIAEMLARNARMYPQDTALIELKPSKNLRKEINWQQFDERANRIANALIRRGIGKGDKVVHLMMNSINWMEAYFGIIRTGAWAVPLNFRFTSKEINYCTDIAEAKAMILGEEFTERAEAIRPQLATIKNYIFAGEKCPSWAENLEKITEESSSNSPDIILKDEDPCGLYFTSGTTGTPKPILLTHRNMECAAITENRHHLQSHDDNYILLPPLYHTGAKMHWFGSLIVGGRGTILTEFSPQNVFKTVHDEKGTIVWLLVPWAQDILGALDRGELKIRDFNLSRWRLMHIGAQPVPPSLVKHWKQYFPDMKYDTNYGLSESTGPGCVHLGMENEHKVGAIGKPGFNWETRIIDDKGNDVPSGGVGELIVRGNGVMREYYKNPQKTAETLKDGWLYTGDMGRADSDGFIYLVDRRKDMVNVGGEKIFPVEVEEVLVSHPKIYDAAVFGVPDERLGEAVAAVIDPKPGVKLTAEEVALFCEQNLPRYKRPRHIFFDKVPRNPTGKIEKPKLREKYGKAQ